MEAEEGRKWGKPGSIVHVSDIRWTGGGCWGVGPIANSATSLSSWLGLSASLLVEALLCYRQLCLTVFLNLLAVGPRPSYVHSMSTVTHVMNAPCFVTLVLLCIIVNANQRAKMQ